MPDHLRITRTGAVATVTMARPEVHNAFNEALIADLHASFVEKRKSGVGAGCRDAPAGRLQRNSQQRGPELTAINRLVIAADKTDVGKGPSPDRRHGDAP